MDIYIKCLYFVCMHLLYAGGQLINEIQNHLEFEDVLTDSQDDFWVWRSEAYNLKTLRLEDGNRTHTIELTLCIEPALNDRNVTVVVDDVVYSNDGPPDKLYFSANGIKIGDFTTIEKWMHGQEWNVFRNSGRIGPTLIMSKGNYTINIEVETDKWGVELDRIEINAENQDLKTNLFCNARMYRKL